MMDGTTQQITALIITLALVVVLLIPQFTRRLRERFLLRTLPAYQNVPLMVGAAIEAGRPVHVSWGSSGIGGENTALTLAVAELVYQVTLRAASGSIAPVLTLSDPAALPLAYGTLRRAYAARRRLDRFAFDSVRWYPYGPRSLAFAAGLTVLMSVERASSNILVGSYGTELALILGSSARRRLMSVAASDQLEGQAVAFAMADAPLIGEEMFQAAAYLGDPATRRLGGVIALDVLRWLLIAVFIFAIAYNLIIAGGVS